MCRILNILALIGRYGTQGFVASLFIGLALPQLAAAARGRDLRICDDDLHARRPACPGRSDLASSASHPDLCLPHPQVTPTSRSPPQAETKLHHRTAFANAHRTRLWPMRPGTG